MIKPTYDMRRSTSIRIEASRTERSDQLAEANLFVSHTYTSFQGLRVGWTAPPCGGGRGCSGGGAAAGMYPWSISSSALRPPGACCWDNHTPLPLGSVANCPGQSIRYSPLTAGETLPMPVGSGPHLSPVRWHALHFIQRPLHILRGSARPSTFPAAADRPYPPHRRRPLRFGRMHRTAVSPK